MSPNVPISSISYTSAAPADPPAATVANLPTWDALLAALDIFLFFSETLLPVWIAFTALEAIPAAILAPAEAGIPTWTSASVILPAAVSLALSSNPWTTSPTTELSKNSSSLATALSSIFKFSPRTAS